MTPPIVDLVHIHCQSDSDHTNDAVREAQETPAVE